MSEVQITSSLPFDDQKPGTAGLRKKVRVIQQPNYLENFLQAIFNSTSPAPDDRPLVIGGDGRYFNDVAIQTCLRIAAGNGVRNFIVGQHGLLSTPAASHAIRHHQAMGGLILSASHNPAGPDGDFGIKFNVANGGQASESLTDAIYANSRQLDQYRSADLPEIDLTRCGTTEANGVQIRVIDPVDDYALLMQRLFDFDLIRDYLQSGKEIAFDAMHAVTGPYARQIFGKLLGVADSHLLNCEPLPDFGGGHPDPNLVYARTLVDRMNGANAPDFGAASDGDGDRNMILGRGIFVSPGDSLAVLADNLTLCPGYRDGLAGVARSMPTSRALDAVAQERGHEMYETPTGWRFFCNLLDAGRISLCGEESFGTGSDHVREKDGLWAVLAWLNILAARRQSVAEVMQQHWQKYGRHYYARHDFEVLKAADADTLLAALKAGLHDLPGTEFNAIALTQADEFNYHDPIDGSVSKAQGIRLVFGDAARVVVRLSGTGTEGATLRVYLEQLERVDFTADVQETLQPLADWAADTLQLEKHLGRTEPDLRT